MERRVALVTGGAKGIGKAIVCALAEQGFSLAIGYNSSEKEATTLALDLQKKGVNAIAVKADVSKKEEVEKMYEITKKYFGFVDTLINNAGISLVKPLCDCTEEEYDSVMSTNLKSVFLTCKAYSPDMVSERFGRIVNISSVWGEYGASTEVIYSASKAGVIGFTKALNAELAINGVIVNCVSPGIIATDMNAHLSESEVQEFTKNVSLGRVGTPEEVAKVVELLTRKDVYIAGANISVNGGIL